ncbi:AAA family ATPase [Victivallis vadensis]|uniref:AAA family ATPase n=1 Tax=Victivallis vadensis TaxID=172901 RepID=UPI002599381F|nr:AAA family ATPase [uncultured Victivallis sp.]
MQYDLERLPGDLERLGESFAQLRAEIGKAVIGQQEVIEAVLAALLAGGHCLLQGVPGLAKTLLVQSLGQALDLDFRRVQFTPDLMPGDITGSEILDEEPGSGRRELRFVPGPVFTNLLLADEINRTPPKTQAALLEAMQEKQISNHGMRLPLPRPFFVLATQNPIEQEGTYPLPEAQLDRFMFLIRLTYPERDQEIAILRETTGNGRPAPQPVLNAEQLIYLQRCVREIPVSDHVIAYCADLARMSRPENPEAPAFIRENLSYGAGPRAGQYLLLAARAAAALEGRLNVSCADVRRFAPEVLRHRIACNFHAVGENLTSDMIVEQLIGYVPESAE